MEECKYHQKEAVSRCSICKAKLCKECDDFQNKFGRCPKCAKQSVAHLHQNLKRGLIQNVLSVICAASFLAIYVVQLCLGSASTTFIVFGAIVIALLAPLTVFMFIYNLKNIKKLKYFLGIAEREDAESANNHIDAANDEKN